MLKSKFMVLPYICFVTGLILTISFPGKAEPALFFDAAMVILVGVSWRDINDEIS